MRVNLQKTKRKVYCPEVIFTSVPVSMKGSNSLENYTTKMYKMDQSSYYLTDYVFFHFCLGNEYLFSEDLFIQPFALKKIVILPVLFSIVKYKRSNNVCCPVKDAVKDFSGFIG